MFSLNDIHCKKCVLQYRQYIMQLQVMQFQTYAILKRVQKDSNILEMCWIFHCRSEKQWEKACRWILLGENI